MTTLKVLLIIFVACAAIYAQTPASCGSINYNAVTGITSVNQANSDTGVCYMPDSSGNLVQATCRIRDCSSTDKCQGAPCISSGKRGTLDCSSLNTFGAEVHDCTFYPSTNLVECPGCGACKCVVTRTASNCDPTVTDPNDPSYCGDSPLIVDLKNEGFHLTSAANGVMFDFAGTGKPIKLSWTDPKYNNAWLVLDRNGNGKIDSALEMFGNITSQPKSDTPNGYLALAEFDKPENGGNNNGYIDAGDAVYSKLRLWVDANHDGISQPEELFTLASQGITALDLKFSESDFVDEFGNRFRYQAILVDDKGFHNNHRTYDVFLVVDKKKGN
jgi:hypothetical protein